MYLYICDCASWTMYLLDYVAHGGHGRVELYEVTLWLVPVPMDWCRF